MIHNAKLLGLTAAIILPLTFAPAACTSGGDDKKDVAPVEEPLDTSPAECGTGIEPGSVEGLERWPYLQSIDQTSAVVAFGAAADVTEAKVAYSRTDAYESEVSAEYLAISGDDSESGDSFELNLFSAKIEGLQPGTEYCYRISAGGVELASALILTTAPPSSETEVSFIAIGDYGSGTTDQTDLRDVMAANAAGIDFWLTTGDNAYGEGTHYQFQYNVFEVYQDLWHAAPVWPVIGNHDIISDNAQPYLDDFFLPETAWREEDKERYYSFDWGPVHVTALDSEIPTIFSLDESSDDDMADWLDADLAGTDRPWKIVIMHKPPYSGHPTRLPDPIVREKLVPIFEQHGVQLVLLGHNHFYERFHPIKAGELSTLEDGGIVYIVDGGGGKALYDIGEAEFQALIERKYSFVLAQADTCTLNIRALGLEGEEIDNYTMERCFGDAAE